MAPVTSISADDPSLPGARPKGGRREVMLVEDSLDYAQAVTSMLDYGAQGESFDVAHFTRVGDAAAYLPTSAVCCVLLDLNLPDASGVDAVRALQAVAPLVPIVVLSGVDDDQVALDAMHEGAQDYLVKGRADADLITRSLRYAMERARTERQRMDLVRERTARAEAETAVSTVSRLERLTEAALGHLSLEDLQTELLEHVSEMLNADTAAILLLDEERGVLELSAAKGLEEAVKARVTIPVGSGIAGRIVSERRSIVIDDVQSADVVSPVVRERVKSLVGVPLMADRRIVGVMHVGTTQPRHFTAEDTVVLQLAADRLPDVPGLELAARYLPGAAGAEVGGDWYDVIPLADGRVGIAMGDVVGRGIPAASLMGQLRNALRAYAVEGHPPAHVVERLDRLVQTLNPGRMATLLYMVLEPDTRALTFANAGHLPPLLAEPDSPPRLLQGARGVPLGVLPYASFEDAGATVAPGSTLVVYTDGLVEERGISLEERLAELQRIAALGFDGPNDLCERLLSALLPGGPGVDDVAVLALTTAPASSDRLSLTLPAEPEALITARRALRNWLYEIGTGPDTLYDITLATGEACTNAIEHAYAPGEASFDLEGTYADEEIRIVVRDYGSWRPPRGQNRGRGLKLMETLMDHVNVQRGATGTTVEMTRRIDGAGDRDAG
jgi:FixJ family two-component response regulator/anti-sigma regulatory factor (Ser/Thr protein kinase)/putative methionine-R-sulfoxide reductase with GAF domain